MKIVAGIVPVIALCLLGQFVFGFEKVQLWTVYATLVPTVLFIVAYIPERPDRHWFSTSLLLLAFGVLAVVIVALLVRVVGQGFPGQPWVVTTWLGLTFVSMNIRTLVLLSDQARDGRGFGAMFARRH